MVHRVEDVKRELAPELVFTHHAGDLNVDHRATARAVLTAFRPLPGEPPTTLLAFETRSSTEWTAPGHGPAFTPNWCEDASPGLERKVAAMKRPGTSCASGRTRARSKASGWRQAAGG